MIAIINYDAGNLRNVQKVIDLHGHVSQITASPDHIIHSKGIILPGVGHFRDGMDNLERLHLVEVIRDAVLVKKIPILGICLGMQLLSFTGYEGGKGCGLELLDMRCKLLETGDNSLNIPHIGWNSIKKSRDSRLLRLVPDDSDFYFVHSYAVQTSDESLVSSTAKYGSHFVSSVERDNIYATQFHPEKSQKYGKLIIKNFIDIVNS